MNRRSFLSRCLSGAVLGMARVLPMPEMPMPSKWAQPGDVWFETKLGPVTIEMRRDFVRIMSDKIGSDMMTATELVLREREAQMTLERRKRIRLAMDGWTP